MNIVKSLVIPGALALTAVTGVAAGTALNSFTASADTTGSSTTSSSTSQSTPAGQPDPSKGGHAANGKTETVLTGDSATKAKAAALAKVPGATVIRAETDAEGAAYEVHLQKSDGSMVTVKLDSSYNVTTTEDGMR